MEVTGISDLYIYNLLALVSGSYFCLLILKEEVNDVQEFKLNV